MKSQFYDPEYRELMLEHPEAVTNEVAEIRGFIIEALQSQIYISDALNVAITFDIFDNKVMAYLGGLIESRRSYLTKLSVVDFLQHHRTHVEKGIYIELLTPLLSGHNPLVVFQANLSLLMYMHNCFSYVVSPANYHIPAQLYRVAIAAQKDSDIRSLLLPYFHVFRQLIGDIAASPDQREELNSMFNRCFLDDEFEKV